MVTNINIIAVFRTISSPSGMNTSCCNVQFEVNPCLNCVCVFFVPINLHRHTHRYWLPTYSNRTERVMTSSCDHPDDASSSPGLSFDFGATTPQFQELCVLARSRRHRNEPGPDSYLRHFWVQSDVKGSPFHTNDTVSLCDVVPNLQSVSEILGLQCD